MASNFEDISGEKSWFCVFGVVSGSILRYRPKTSKIYYPSTPCRDRITRFLHVAFARDNRTCCYLRYFQASLGV
ncbi:hypothetical protein E4T56_gene13201 [Termitomyces sp. T112]|nr:hypothetical protein E4T56_gene13201 [Termitomyces sp. T112]